MRGGKCYKNYKSFAFNKFGWRAACLGDTSRTKGKKMMQNLRTIVIVGAFSILLVGIATTHAMSVLAEAFSVGSVAIFALAAVFGVATKLRA
jgi:hypothetical protein